MKFENIKVYNFENAIRGARNPLDSWNKSDSAFGIIHEDFAYEIATEIALTYFKDKNPDDLYNNLDYETTVQWLFENGGIYHDNNIIEYNFIGKNDMDLLQRLIKGGSEHRKFMRQIFVTVDITAPLYWWKEFDTYKIGVTANSTSTMHTIQKKPITLDCFERDDLNKEFCGDFIEKQLIPYLESLRQKFLTTKDKRYWKELIRWLPESWHQKRTVTLNYENLYTIAKQRQYHKLNEWSGKDNDNNINFMSFVKQLPYAYDLILLDEEI